MLNLSNPIADKELSPTMLDREPSMSRVGYTVRTKEGVFHLLPQFDPVGFSASLLGETVEVSSIGIGVQATVIRILEGFSSKSYTDTKLDEEEKSS